MARVSPTGNALGGMTDSAVPEPWSWSRSWNLGGLSLHWQPVEKGWSAPFASPNFRE
jgi:hypothetical protein